MQTGIEYTRLEQYRNTTILLNLDTQKTDTIATQKTVVGQLQLPKILPDITILIDNIEDNILLMTQYNQNKLV